MNSELYNKEFSVPSSIITKLQELVKKYPTHSKGINRANNILNSKEISYQQMKRIKNYFDHCNEKDFDQIEYELNGGDTMKSWVNSKLNSERSSIKQTKKIQSNYMDNSVRDYSGRDSNTIRLNNKRNVTSISESVEEKNTVGIAVVLRQDGKILLVRRSEDDDWGAGKWALVGGGIEKGETPENGLVRELSEEISVNKSDILSINLKFEVFKDNGVEYIYLIVINNDSEIKINSEHEEFSWFDIKNIPSSEKSVPLLKKYIALAVLSNNKLKFKK